MDSAATEHSRRPAGASSADYRERLRCYAPAGAAGAVHAALAVTSRKVRGRAVRLRAGRSETPIRAHQGQQVGKRLAGPGVRREQDVAAGEHLRDGRALRIRPRWMFSGSTCRCCLVKERAWCAVWSMRCFTQVSQWMEPQQAQVA